jgi:hypothetical protein
MATEWRVRAVHLGNCNCAYGCPCKFNASPTHGACRSAIAYEIKEGYFGSIRLDGLRAVLITSWPGAIHEGNGTMQVIIDERADESQRDALLNISRARRPMTLRPYGGSFPLCARISWNRYSCPSSLPSMSKPGAVIFGCPASSRRSASRSETR